MLMLYDDLELIEMVLDVLSEYYAAMINKILEYDLSFLYIGDDVAYKSACSWSLSSSGIYGYIAWIG